MGLFDIFKKADSTKKAVVTPAPAEEINKVEPAGAEEKAEPELESQLSTPAEPVDQDAQRRSSAGLKNTESVAKLLNVPKEERRETWLRQFLADLPFAALRCGTPQLIAGPDGFPYFQLFVPEPAEEFQSYVIDEMIGGFLVEKGYGIVLNPGDFEPDWVLTYGDILNYHLNGTFFSVESLFSDRSNAQQEIPKGEQVMIGQPSEAILPVHTRRLLKDFFQLNGIRDPKVMLLVCKNREEVYQDLAFNITPASFETDKHYRDMMQTITWYLPRHYAIVGLDEGQAKDHFMPL
jgi:hypothetical protein